MRVVMFLVTTRTGMKCNVFDINGLVMLGVRVVILLVTTRTCVKCNVFNVNDLAMFGVRVVPTGQV